MPDRKTDPQSRQTGCFGQRPQHQQIGQRSEISQGHHAVSSEGFIELIHHHQRGGRSRSQLQDPIRRQPRAGGIVGIAEHQHAGGLRQRLQNRVVREEITRQLMGHRLNHHALHACAGGVVTKGGTRGEQRVAGAAVGLEHGMNRRIHPVEDPHMGWAQGLGKPSGRRGQVGHHRFPQAVVFGIDGQLISGNSPQRLRHLRAGPHGVLVEIEPQHPPPAFQRGAVRLQALHISTRRRDPPS